MKISFSYPKHKIKVLLAEGIHPTAVRLLKEEGYSVEAWPNGFSASELSAQIPKVSILGIRSSTEVHKQILQNASKLLAIGAFCIGTDQVDLTECSKRGIAVFNAPYSNTRSVVELVLGEMIFLMRRLAERNFEMHQGRWTKSSRGCFEIRGKTLGIVGYGNIGSQLSVLAESLGMRVIYYDLLEKLAMGNAKKCRFQTELLQKADIISVHVDGRASNAHLFGESQFQEMKSGALFINSSRGHVVDLKALKKYLENGKLGGAALDVHPEEPSESKTAFASGLKGFPNVILTPHIGGATEEAQRAIAEYVPMQLIEYINTGNSLGSVNLPAIQLTAQVNAHRLLHIHENVPGILAKVNGILAKNHMNIVGQYLKTNEAIGYLITDVDKNYPKAIIQELKKVPHTLKFRVLY